MCIHSSVNEPKSVVSHCATVLCKFPCATIHSTIHWIVDASFLDSLDTPKKQPPCLLCRGVEFADSLRTTNSPRSFTEPSIYEIYHSCDQ